jgi:hypothetical protein
LLFEEARNGLDISPLLAIANMMKSEKKERKESKLQQELQELEALEAQKRKFVKSHVERDVRLRSGLPGPAPTQYFSRRKLPMTLGKRRRTIIEED